MEINNKSDHAVIVGGSGWTQLGETLSDVDVPNWDFELLDTAAAWDVPRLIGALSWRINRRPPLLSSFSASVVSRVRESNARVLIATGLVPILASDLDLMGRGGVRRVNISTDDPWSPKSKADWFLRALPHYDAVYTPRTANVGELESIGVKDVSWLPFGFDPRHCVGAAPTEEDVSRLACDVLFVGGADTDRAPYIHALVAAGLHVAVYGGYWSRFAPHGADVRGRVSAETVRLATLSARVVLILTRRSNRDGHTMRSIEAGAIGGALLAEDTPDHRNLYGDDAIFFSDADGMVQGAQELLADPARRLSLADQVRIRIRNGKHEYKDRLRAILEFD